MTNDPLIQETEKIKEMLFTASGELVQARAVSESLQVQLSQLNTELETTRNSAFVEQSALGKAGVMTAGDAKAREVQFDVWLRQQSDYADQRGNQKDKEMEVLNAKITEQSARTRFDALKAVAEIQVAMLGYESQTIAAQTVIRKMEADQAMLKMIQEQAPQPLETKRVVLHPDTMPGSILE